MSCVVDLAAALGERLVVSTTVHHVGEAASATVRFRVAGEPVELSVTTPDTAALIHALMRAAQQLCDKAVAVGVTLPGEGWGRASLLLDALVALAGDGAGRWLSLSLAGSRPCWAASSPAYEPRRGDAACQGGWPLRWSPQPTVSLLRCARRRSTGARLTGSPAAADARRVVRGADRRRRTRCPVPRRPEREQAGRDTPPPGCRDRARQ
ncbi:MAG: hypothetical protein ACRDYA_03040 [Egibacteraceae bacterium]